MTTTFGPMLDAEIAYRREQLTDDLPRRNGGWLPWKLRHRPAHG
jgi:hypothetical protein